MSESRRTFLMKVVTGVAYSAPAIHSLATPEGLLGQDHSETTGKGGKMRMEDEGKEPPGMGTAQVIDATPGTQTTGPGRPAPWQIPPPGGG